MSKGRSQHRGVHCGINRRNFTKSALVGFGGVLGFGRSYAQQVELPSLSKPSNEPLPYVDGSFTLIALPDTQIYSQRHPHHFHRQTEWIVRNREKFNIQFVMHLGDITNTGVSKEWKVAKKAMSLLDGEVPYSVIVGNHDLGLNGRCTSRDTLFEEYFPLSEARKHAAFGGSMNSDFPANRFHKFDANGMRLLVLALEWGPRDPVVEWANKVVSEHPDHDVILTTHAYLYFDDTRHDFAKYKDGQRWNPHTYPTAKLDGGTNDGQELWDKLISKHKKFFLTLNGHVLDDGQGRLASQGVTGSVVHQVLANYQMHHQGGDGFLRLIEFLPDGKTVQMKSYSPSPDNYKTDPQNLFVLNIDFS